MLKPIHPEWREIPWDRALTAASPNVASLLEKALAGKDLGFEEGLTLATVEGNDLLALVKVADELRRRVVGDRITYVVNRNLNFTNVCIVGCAFCGFSRGAGCAGRLFSFHGYAGGQIGRGRRARRHRGVHSRRSPERSERLLLRRTSSRHQSALA